mmetsp:Transcript_24499/g.75672  ORF Transcript_24499/g.75672 Transcript_24499/m.75672 type:complete len:292 (-) Transcript_24499:33-908(-)
MLVEAHVVFQDVEHARHLREHQNAVASGEEADHQLVQQNQLAAVFDEVFSQRRQRPVLDVREQVGVVAALSQLHGQVQNGRPRRAGSSGVVAGAPSHDVDLPEETVAVDVALRLGHGREQDGFGLGGQGLFDVVLQSPEDEGSQEFVELFYDGGLGVGVDDLQVEELVEFLRRRKDVREEEIQQRPELVQVVLQRRSGNQEAVLDLELSHGLRELGVFVFDAVRLVHDEHAPAQLHQRRLFQIRHLVGRHHHVPRAALVLARQVRLRRLLPLVVRRRRVVSGGQVGHAFQE